MNTEHTNQPVQAEPVNQQLLALVKSFGHKTGCAKNAFGEQCTCGADEVIAAAEQAQQAEPVARDVLMALARDVERELISGGYVAFSEQELASIVDRHAARLPVEMHSTGLNDRKAAEIIQTQGFTATGYVLTGQDGRYALCNGGAVRWLDKAEFQHIMFPGVEHSPVPVPGCPNQYGLDTPYFARWLNRVIKKMDYYRPDDFARELGRMAAAADKTALLQDQLSGAVAQEGADK